MLHEVDDQGRKEDVERPQVGLLGISQLVAEHGDEKLGEDEEKNIYKTSQIK